MRVDRESGISRHIRSNVVGYIALFCFALSGTAYATHPGGANTISTGDIQDGQVQNADLGSSAVTGAKVSSSTLDGSDVATSGLTGSDIAADSLTGSDIGTGAVGTSEQANSIPAARVARDTTQSVPNITTTTLSFTLETYDTASMHSTSSNTSRLTAPVTGIYEVSANADWSGFSTSVPSIISLFKNGSSTIAFEQTSADQAMSISTMVRLVAGDYVEVRVFQNSSATRNIQPIVDYSPRFSMTWLAPGP